MFQRCTHCGQLPSQPVDGGIRVVCRCGATSVEFRQPVDIEAVKRLTRAALERARVRVHAVPALRGNGFTLSVEREPQLGAGMSEADARRYADAVNGEAELARATLQLLAELEDLRARVGERTGGGAAPSQPAPPRHGSGMMPRVTLPSDPDNGDDGGQEQVG